MAQSNGASDAGGGARIKTLPNGVRVLSETVPGATSVALGIWIRAGSRDERDEVAGITHLMEHMLFKGTPDRDALKIAQEFEGIGAQENAATGEEYTMLYARFLPEHLGSAMGIMSDMVRRPTLADLEREREVIVEEIRMYEDRPDQMAEEHLASLIFHGDGLGKPIIGSAQTVRGVDHDTLSRFHRETYNGSNVFVVAAGNLDPEELESLTEEQLGGLPEGESSARNSRIADPESRFFYKHKDTEQYHVALGSLGLPANSGDRYAMAALNNVLGGAMSSRLFQEVREKRGLAYAVLSFHESFSDAGANEIYVGSTTDNVEEAVQVIAEQLRSIQEEKIGEDELRRTREQLKSQTLLALENTSARMTRIGRSVITGSELLTPEEISRRIEAVTAEDIQRLAREHLRPERMYLSAVGPQELDLGRFLNEN